MSISMALVDYIPVTIFLISMIKLQRDLYNKMSKGAFAVFSCGGIMVFTAGLFKASWKLLYCANICDFQALSQTFFPMQATGFLLTAAGIVAMLCYPQGSGDKLLSVAVVPAVFKGTFIFVTMMCLGLIGLCASLSVIAVKMKKSKIVILFAVACIGLLGMGYMSTKDFTDPMMNWIAEILNTASQTCLLCGVIALRKGGLRDFVLK